MWQPGLIGCGSRSQAARCAGVLSATPAPRVLRVGEVREVGRDAGRRTPRPRDRVAVAARLVAEDALAARGARVGRRVAGAICRALPRVERRAGRRATTSRRIHACCVAAVLGAAPRTRRPRRRQCGSLRTRPPRAHVRLLKDPARATRRRGRYGTRRGPRRRARRRDRRCARCDRPPASWGRGARRSRRRSGSLRRRGART